MVERRKHAQMDMVSMFGRCRGGGCTPSIKSMPIWAIFQCSAGGEVVDTHQASKKCRPGMVSMFGMVDRRQTSKPCPDGRSFDVREVVEADGGWVEERGGWKEWPPLRLAFRAREGGGDGLNAGNTT